MRALAGTHACTRCWPWATHACRLAPRASAPSTSTAAPPTQPRAAAAATAATTNAATTNAAAAQPPQVAHAQRAEEHKQRGNNLYAQQRYQQVRAPPWLAVGAALPSLSFLPLPKGPRRKVGSNAREHAVVRWPCPPPAPAGRGGLLAGAGGAGPGAPHPHRAGCAAQQPGGRTPHGAAHVVCARSVCAEAGAATPLWQPGPRPGRGDRGWRGCTTCLGHAWPCLPARVPPRRWAVLRRRWRTRSAPWRWTPPSTAPSHAPPPATAGQATLRRAAGGGLG